MRSEESIWSVRATLEELNEMRRDTMLDRLGIEFSEIGPDFLKGTMPVDGRTRQPYGILHGGANVALAETLGSMAANLCVEAEKEICVGLDISANHVRQVVSGEVSGTARPLHIGGRTHVWEIRIDNSEGRLVSICRLTMIVLPRLREERPSEH